MELGNWIAMFIGRQENSATGPYHEYNVPIKVWAESRRACELTIVESIAVPAWNVKKRWDGSVDPGDIHRTESAITFPLTIDPDQIKDVDKIPILILDHIYPAQAIRTTRDPNKWISLPPYPVFRDIEGSDDPATKYERLLDLRKKWADNIRSSYNLSLSEGTFYTFNLKNEGEDLLLGTSLNFPRQQYIAALKSVIQKCRPTPDQIENNTREKATEEEAERAYKEKQNEQNRQHRRPVNRTLQACLLQNPYLSECDMDHQNCTEVDRFLKWQSQCYALDNLNRNQ